MNGRGDRGATRNIAATIGSYAKRVYSEFSEDRVAAVAAGITFFVLLALFPAIASIVSLYGLFADRASIAHTVDALGPYLPGGAISVLDAELKRLVAEKPEKLDIAFFSSSAIALWSASGGVKALIDGLNVAFERKETRSFLKLTRHALLFTTSAIIAVAIAVYLSVMLPGIIGRFTFSRALVITFDILRWPAAFVIVTLLLGLLYRVGPDRAHARWISWGSAIGGALLIVATLAFSWYTQNFGSYDRTYGNLGAAVGFLTWIWISMVVVLTGAELDCEIERTRRNGSQR